EAAGDAKYLSRNDWIGTFPSHDGQVTSIISTWGNEINGTDSGGNPASFLYGKEATADLLQDLDSFDSRSPIDPASFSDSIVYGAKNGVQLIDLRGLDYNDPLWEKLLDELSAEDYYNVVGISGYGTAPIKSIGKPFGTDADTAAGLIYGGTGQMYPSPVVLAMTWNADIALRYGEMIGTEAILGGADGWYAPSMNIHRTPFSGRNGEYYSEDGYLSGAFASLETKGAASKGMYAYVKHFAFNDQENHRGDGTGQFSLVTWLNEQSIRELYLVPFEMCMKAGDVDLNFLQKSSDGKLTNATRSIRACSAVMTAFNRVGSTWTGGSYPLITGILRNEWAFDGFVITDNANTGVYMDGYQMIEAGADAKLTSASESARFDFDKDNPAHYHYAREAIHHVLYTIANSKAMIGAMPGSVYKAGVQIIDIIQGALYAVLSGLLALVCTFAVRRFMPKRQAVLTLPRQAK
ncbi:MAG: beta-glucosidase, partial [Clostridiales bacterium]|nr:beta-glucosidase [Clostridiales bacterium]